MEFSEATGAHSNRDGRFVGSIPGAIAASNFAQRTGVEPKYHFGKVSRWLRGQSWVQTGERLPRDVPSN